MVIFLRKLKNVVFFLFSFLICQSALASSDDDYLKQLEMEAGDDLDAMPAVLNTTEDGNSTNGLILDAPASENELISDKKKLIVDINSFESAMKEAYPESYELYVQLDGEHKNIIYQEFKKHKRLYNSSVKVISVYLSSH